MSKHRFYVPGDFQVGSSIQLSPEEAKHAHKVLRLNLDSEILLVNGKNLEAIAKIESISKSQMLARIVEVKELQKKQGQVVLLQALLKGPKMDWLVEKVTEIGVDQLQPVISEFSVAKENKLDRWQRLAESAMKQSGNALIPEIHEPCTLEMAAEKCATAKAKFLLQPGAPHSLLQCLQKCRNTQADQSQVVLAIGPEGGFSPKEEQFLLSKGFIPAALSQNILRGESAAILTTGICRHFLDFS